MTCAPRLAIALVSLAGATVTAADWPQWRGPNRDGTAPTSPPLVSALPADGLKPAWLSEKLPGGFTVELLHEFDHTLFPRWPFLVQEGKTYRLPPEMPSIPLMFSLRAHKTPSR